VLKTIYQCYREQLASVVIVAGCVVFLASSTVGAEGQSWRLIPDIHQRTVWRAYTDGTISTIDFPVYVNQTNSGISIQSYPIPSPDQRKIAYVKNNDLWVYDIEENTDNRLTNIGQPEDDKFTSVYVETVSWSADSKRVLYRVLSGVSEPEEPGPPIVERDAKFGMRVTEIETRANSSIEVQSDFEPVWLPNGNFLVGKKSASRGNLHNELHLYDVGHHESRQITKERAWY
jgi:Tol biopolymer transport system component